jgi:cardiolipin synthase
VAAAKRGVRVRLILPKYSDWPSYIFASEYLYEYFLKRGVEIYLWEKSIMHGKLAIVDNNWATIGSFNLNYTSYLQNLEMNVDIYTDKYIHYLRDEMENMILTGCERVDPNRFMEKSSLKMRATRFVFYIMLSLIAGFSIGLSFQEDNSKGNRLYNILRIITSLIFFILGVIGTLLPIMPAFPFFIISFLLVYRQILLNKKLG